MNMTIGANIKRLRTARNITQEQLAEVMNVTCAAVSKWERGETYPDITLLQPLAYYFGVSLDELMGYNPEKVRTEIEETIALYRKTCRTDSARAREIITKAYHDYPNDYWIMHHYMWNMAGELADNDPAVLLANREEFLSICEKILAGCTEENLRLNAWNMRAKILHAEGKTEEALAIYKDRFTDWYTTCGQKSEQLFAKDTEEYYFHVQKNMYELADFAADKWGRTVFFHPSLSMAEKTERAVHYGEVLLGAFDSTGDDFFLMLAMAFLVRMENDLFYRGGKDEEVAAVLEKLLQAAKKLAERMAENKPLRDSYADRRALEDPENVLERFLHSRLHARGGRRAELLKNPVYAAVLQKYS